MSALSVAEVLERAADLIEPEGAWTQGEFALNADGEITGLSEFRGAAVCWCALGAINKASAGDDSLEDVAELILRNLVVRLVDEWNDAPERTQAEVVAKLREAAALARAETLPNDEGLSQ